MIRTAALLSIAGIVLTVLLAALWPARSEQDRALALPARESGVLDGLSFDGMFGPTDGSSDRPDVLQFGDGRFWSRNCVPCGFSPGAYRTRVTDDGIHFEGVLVSPDRGRFQYTGVVRNGHILARMNWRKERWYWTIDKDFRFKGVRSDSSAMDTAMHVTRVALAANPAPDQCRL